jgi:DNA-binding transcriptional MerR regulator
MEKPNRLVPDSEVARRYGVHVTTLRNWDQDPDLNFPKPVRINGRKFRQEQELNDFDARRAAARTPAA